jgi:3-hydroxybenzoate 6-monooxygenase
MPELPMIIAGGGLGGLTAALALAQRGLAVLLLERSEEFKEIGAGVQLGPNVFRVFDQLGIREQVSSRAAFPDALVMMDSISGEVVTRIPLKGAFLERFGHPYALLHRGDLLNALLEACREDPRICLKTSQNVSGFVDHGDHVSVDVEDGSRHEGAALVGADGLWSGIREAMLSDGPPRRSGHIAYRAVLTAEDVPPHLRNNDMTLWGGPKNHLVYYPLRRGELFNLVAVFHSDRYVQGWDTQGDPEELHKRFEAVVPEVKTMLEKVGKWRMWILCDRDPIQEWSKGRVTLLGDAAHPMLQYLGQGAGMSIEDAVVLAEEVSAAGGDCAKAFACYQAKRYVRAGRAQLTSRLYGEFFHAAGASREIRNAFLRGRTEEQAREGVAWLYDGF